MKSDELMQLVDRLVTNQLTPDEHEKLQTELKANAEARRLFRARIDLEAGLRSWAQEEPGLESRQRDGMATSAKWWMAIAATLMLVLIPFVVRSSRQDERDTAAVHVVDPDLTGVGVVRQQECVWKDSPALVNNRFGVGRLELESGVAKLNFRSGTDLVLQGPCSVDVIASDSAKLLAGSVYVNVSDVSSGFVMQTPEATIVDEGTEYAVALASTQTEVHVFDGSVFWVVDGGENEFRERINSGEAKSYLRSDPRRSGFVPFGQRKFVRDLEATIKQNAGQSLLAYDGFENIAGRLRRGRSGFGFADGWQPAGRVRGRVAQVVDASSGMVFGSDRLGRRMLAVANGDDLRRNLETPVVLSGGDDCFLSMIVARDAAEGPEATQSDLGEPVLDSSLRISLEPDVLGRRRLRKTIHFGINEEAFPYVNAAGSVVKTATSIAEDDVLLLVLKISAEARSASLRLYRNGEDVDLSEPDTWTVHNNQAGALLDITSVRITSGSKGAWFVDELRIGTSWEAVTAGF